MEKLLVNGVEIEFNDLSLEAQKKLYLQNKAKFQKEAAKSKYVEIRRLLVKDEECEESTLDELFEIETKIYGDITLLYVIWYHPKFKKTDEKRKELLESDSAEIRKILASDHETSSKILNEMLRNEVQNEQYQNEDVVDAISYNLEFEMEQETFQILAKSKYREKRLWAAEYEDASSESLNEMLRNEVKNEEYQEDDVKENILENSKFKMEEETLKVLAKSEEWRDRRRAAKCECEYVSSEFLNDMLRIELNGESDDDVMSAILENSKFKMDDETRRQLINYKSFDYRQMVIKDAGTSKELLEEMYLNETDEKKLEMIEEELFSRFGKKTVTLDAVQKKKILKVLKELKHSKKRQPLSNYLEKILEIIA